MRRGTRTGVYHVVDLRFLIPTTGEALGAVCCVQSKVVNWAGEWRVGVGFHPLPTGEGPGWVQKVALDPRGEYGPHGCGGFTGCVD